MRPRASKSSVTFHSNLILILNSLDQATDSHVQKLLRSKFTHHTLIAVAHKLDTILDFDKVVVMNKGQLVEYGSPHKLLERQGSWFKSLYEDVAQSADADGGLELVS
jgi:ATP-binding cassette subfamily C (CFTR/MRP) protein 1